MDRAQKEQLVQSLNSKFSDAEIVIVTRQSGLTVAEANDLRRQVRAAGASYKVTKNRLVKLALQGTKYEALEPFFIGPTAITFSGDPVSAAKVCVEFAKKNEKLTIIGGAMSESMMDENTIKALASLPSLDELRGKIIGLVQAPGTKVAGVLQAPASQLARVFSAYSATDKAA